MNTKMMKKVIGILRRWLGVRCTSGKQPQVHGKGADGPRCAARPHLHGKHVSGSPEE